MDHSEFIRLLKTDHYAPAELEKVNEVCKNYPMFNLAHMLKVRIKEALDQEKEADLRLAAVYSSDRKRLYNLVKEVVKHESAEEEQIDPQEPERIQFSDEPNHEADVIIEQHAPYAGPEPTEDLLELDEDSAEDAFTMEAESLEVPPSEDLASDVLVQVEQKQKTTFNDELIQSFIVEEPGPIRADMKSSLKGDVSLSSIREHDGFITDTLAKIYVKQGLYAKAIYAYEKLSLKYPEKSAYFAAQIEKIKNINHS